MSVSRSTLPTRRRRRTADAITLPSREWCSPAIDATKVNRELNQLWAELSPSPAPTRPAATDEISDGHQSLPTPVPDEPDLPNQPVFTRASTLNLVTVANTSGEAERIQRGIVGLPDFQPSRVISLVTIPVPDEGRDDLRVRVSLLEQPPEQHRPTIRFESVTVEAPRSMAEDLASVASPLLISELGDCLWWPGDGVSRSPIFRNLADVMDRVIVDTSSLSAPPRGLAALKALASTPRGCPVVSDFAWARLTPWRQLVAQFFDQPSTRACLDTIEDLEIVYPTSHERGVSGFTGALLLTGWLASLLNWEASRPFERTRTGYRLVLDGPDVGPPRHQIVVRLRPVYNEIFGRALGAVTLVAKGANPGRFTVERSTRTGLTTSSNIPGEPHVGRMVHAAPATDAELLAEEMHFSDRNTQFEQALLMATRLMPEGTPQS